MDSPSRNPLLLDQNNDPNTSGDDESDEDTRVAGSASVAQPSVKDAYRRSSSSPVDHYNFAYIAFYILGM